MTHNSPRSSRVQDDLFTSNHPSYHAGTTNIRDHYPVHNPHSAPSQTSPLLSIPSSSAIAYSTLECDFEDRHYRLGVGTFGSVHVGRFFGDPVAVKRVVIPGHSHRQSDDPYIRDQHHSAILEFAADIRRYERVSHPGIVRFFGVALPPDLSAALLVTQLMRGGSLAYALDTLRKAKRPLDRSSFARIALQVCGGLRALHAADCPWGDAKPQNILLSARIDAAGFFPENADVKITDFGLSLTARHRLLAETTLAQTGLPPGTYAYKSPEGIAGAEGAESGEGGKKSDIFSFGMVLYEMLTLRIPWRKKNMTEVHNRLSKGERPEWPKSGDPDFWAPVPEAMVNLIESCWDKDPVQRPTAEELFDSLDDFIGSMYEGQRSSSQRTTQGIDNAVDPNFLDAVPVTGSLARVGSKQSTVSTAVAICNSSVDLQSSGLNSTTDTARLVDGSDDGDQHVMYGSLTGITSHMSNGVPKGSPVTSPEPRSLNQATTENKSTDDAEACEQIQAIPRATGITEAELNVHLLGVGAALEDDQMNIMRKMSSNMTTGLEPASSSAITEIPGHTTEVTDASDVPHNEVAGLETTGCLGLQDIPSEEFENKSEQFARQISQAAALIPGSYAYNEDVSAPFLETIASKTIAGDTVEGGNQELASSTASTTSVRRKRSKRLQSIIEKAALAFIELHRRQEIANKIPPKQRKEAADRKALEEAKNEAENLARQAIESAASEKDFSAILGIMKDHRMSRSVTKDAALYLENFCMKDPEYFDLCEEGGVEELMSAVIQGLDDAELCVSYCNSMTALSEHFDDKVGHLMRATGVPSTVIEILEMHSRDVIVQTAGCKTLGAIAGTNELSRSAVATLGGPKAVYKAITKNNSSFHDVELARASMRAVRQIAQDNEKAAEFLVQVGALGAVSRAAEVFTDDCIEGEILAALRAFSFYSSGPRNIIMSSGLRALAEIMLRNREPEFLIQCCQFVRSVAQWRNVDCERAMLQSCIAERITSLMQLSNEMAGEQGARVSWYALQACLFLASFGSRSRQRLRLVGSIDTAVAILNSRRDNPRVVRGATDALAELLKREPEAKQYATNCGAMPALRTAAELHRNNARVRNAVQWTIDSILSGQETEAGPAHGSQVHQELLQSRKEEELSAGKRNGRWPFRQRFLGFDWKKRKQ
eukprot:GFKZ01005211.1.p1 GENE.GFKZ01005211.1~~GFKZ01005211.1.p1  ORF type:complete len:1167 (-),score=176.73 GFKZ01005211.1:219-3719(-)